jgi:hypothetical protein
MPDSISGWVLTQNVLVNKGSQGCCILFLVSRVLEELLLIPSEVLGFSFSIDLRLSLNSLDSPFPSLTSQKY